MNGLKSAWASLLCSLCCLSVMIISAFAMLGSILGISFDLIGNVMMVVSLVLVGWAHWRYWHKKDKTKSDSVMLAIATITVAVTVLLHFLMPCAIMKM